LSHEHRDATLLDQTRLTLDGAQNRIFAIGAALAVVGFGASYALGWGDEESKRHFWFAYLLNYMWVLSLALGALWFVPLQHLTRSEWSVVVRRIAEIVSGTIPVLGLLAIPLLLNLDMVYPWTDTEHMLSDPLTTHKAAFLSSQWFIVRVVIYFVIWSTLALLFRRWSLEQDESGDVSNTFKGEKLAGPALIIYGLSQTLAGFDFLMSLDAHWFSTMLGVYWFAGIVVSFFALMTLLTLGLQRSGRLEKIITIEHFNDYGRAMFAFTFFWAYIAFSQWMLIWYANIPEETGWYLRRQSNGWHMVGYALIVFHWLIPFAGLMSRFTKRRIPLLAFWAAWILIMHWVDLFWLIMPELSPQGVPLQPVDLTLWLGMAGVFIATMARVAGNRSLICHRDPRLVDSLNFENY